MSTSVYYDSAYQKWHARIYHDRRYIHVGRYQTEAEAQEMAEREARRMFPRATLIRKSQDTEYERLIRREIVTV